MVAGLRHSDPGCVEFMPNSRWCRQLVELNDLNAAFPVPRGLALAALKAGLDPGGDAIILV